jgi:Amt family ammonium transporter
MLIEWYRFGKPKLVGLCVGAVAGLATVTPAAGFIEPWGAMIIGFFAAFICYSCIEIRTKMGWDDALDVWGVHGCGGFFGTVMLGVLASPRVNGAQGGGTLFVTQLVAALFTAVYSMVLTYALLFGIGKVVRLKPTAEEMEQGLDMAIHGETAYPDISEFSPRNNSPRKAKEPVDEKKPEEMTNVAL